MNMLRKTRNNAQYDYDTHTPQNGMPQYGKHATWTRSSEGTTEGKKKGAKMRVTQTCFTFILGPWDSSFPARLWERGQDGAVRDVVTRISTRSTPLSIVMGLAGDREQMLRVSCFGHHILPVLLDVLFSYRCA